MDVVREWDTKNREARSTLDVSERQLKGATERLAVASIMKRPHEKFFARQPSNYTTHQWPQHHIRAAGVSLPEVQWGERGQESSRSSRD